MSEVSVLARLTKKIGICDVPQIASHLAGVLIVGSVGSSGALGWWL